MLGELEAVQGQHPGRHGACDTQSARGPQFVRHSRVRGSYMQVCGIVDSEQEPYTPSQDKPADQKRKRTPRSKTMEDYHRLKSTKL